MKLSIRNLPTDITKEQIQQLLQPLGVSGSITSITLVNEGNHNRVTAYIGMSAERVELQLLATRLTNRVWHGRRLFVIASLFWD